MPGFEVVDGSTGWPNASVYHPVLRPYLCRLAMTQPTVDPAATTAPVEPTAQPPEAPPSFVKLAMRNMVKKGGKSLYHFALTTAGLLGLLVGLAYLTR